MYIEVTQKRNNLKRRININRIVSYSDNKIELYNKTIEVLETAKDIRALIISIPQ